MLPRRLKARIAESQALKLRGKSEIASNEPANPYEVATKLGVDVRFLDLPSVEGVYFPQGRGQIVISSLRPAGRQTFTCAHELGHHKLNHGEKLDELIESRGTDKINDLDEFQADTFASFFLMPRAAVLHAFSVRGWRIDNALPEHYYQIAGWLGVGYTTLVGHISRQLKLLEWARADVLMGKNLRSIRKAMMGRDCTGGAFVVDRHWANRTLDCEVGDLLKLPVDAKFDGVAISVADKGPNDLVAIGSETGTAMVASESEGWRTSVRVSRKGYVGRYIYRYLEETPAEQ